MMPEERKKDPQAGPPAAAAPPDMTTLFAPNTLPGEQTDRAYDDLHRYVGLGHGASSS